MLTLVVARGAGGAIGRDGTIPWHAPEDLALFQRETTGGVVIMGRKTWESLPVKPLPRRTNIVVTSRAMAGDGAQFMPLAAALEFARTSQNPRLYGIGGAGIYQALLPSADRLLITEVDISVPDADAFFPEFDESGWLEIARYPLRSHGPSATARELLRRRA
jgi:dihydrofolate reductase